MKRVIQVAIAFALLLVLVAAMRPNGSRKKAPSSSLRPRATTWVKAAFYQLPLAFEANHGQVDDAVKFLARGRGYHLFLTPTEAVLQLRNADFSLRKQDFDLRNRMGFSKRSRPQSAIKYPQSAVLRMQLIGANSTAKITGRHELPGKVEKENWNTTS